MSPLLAVERGSEAPRPEHGRLASAIGGLWLALPALPAFKTCNLNNLRRQINPALLRAEEELTEEHIALGERGAKELMHDRRRAQLDVYLVCAAYRLYVSPTEDAASSGGGGGWHLGEEDGRILDELLKQAAAIGSA